MRRAARAASLVAALALLAGTAVALAAWRAPGASAAPAVVTADAALVLSGDVDYLRVDRAAELFAQGAVPIVVITGAGIGGDSAVTMREECLKRGVPSDRILVETAARSTHENMLFAAPLLRGRGFRRVALVTSAFHMGRAERAARRVMPELDWVSVPVKDAATPSELRRLHLLEWVKLGWYVARGWA